MQNYICVYDFETDGSNPNVCQPVQLASVIIDFRTLELVENSEFCSFMKPEGIDTPEYVDKVKDTIVWHAKNYNPNWNSLDQKGQDDAVNKIIDTWKNAPAQKQVFSDFQTYLLKYNTNQSRRSKWTAPIRAGHNIERFDNIIMDRLCDLYDATAKNGEQKIFHPRDIVDIMKLAFLWFESLPSPKNYNMGELRDFFGMSQDGAHDALVDIRDEALMIQKFIRLHRRYAHKVKFRGSCAKQITS